MANRQGCSLVSSCPRALSISSSRIRGTSWSGCLAGLFCWRRGKRGGRERKKQARRQHLTSALTPARSSSVSSFTLTQLVHTIWPCKSAAFYSCCIAKGLIALYVIVPQPYNSYKWKP
ncbi:uncharacterized protein BDV17DRAFT_144135 [Aspergillus undulatus]|uniref:uncharacterized protein n=1 Tax=Aspergillus undulatus TaxID=1810928 RepID=UPI003CCD59A2